MRQHQRSLVVSTRPDSLIDITDDVASVVTESQVDVGLCVVFVRHTSASLVIQENADPTVLRDLTSWMGELAPESRPWTHANEGADDMPAHARSTITRCSETIPVHEGRLALGTWQGIYLWEHRRSAHRRRVVVHVSGA